MQTASLEAVFTADTRDFDRKVERVQKTFKDLRKDMSGGFDQIGNGIGNMTQAVASFTAPIAAGFAASIHSAMAFDTTMTNVGAVLGKTKVEMEGLTAEVLSLGSNSTFGGQAAAEAFNAIAGGVANADLHMAMLEQSIRTAEAGQADLVTTTDAMVSIMNSYAFTAEEAALASNVLTQTVGMGVGSMDELASAMPQVTGLAHSLGIGLDDLGGYFAFLSTQGNTYAQSGTQVAAMMTALLKPNADMAEGLALIGYETGQAAIDALGLVGVYEAFGAAGLDTEMAAMVGTTEALRGVTALTSDTVDEFMTTYKDGLEGATDAARELQTEAVSYQMNKLRAAVSGVSIKIGSALLPVLNDLVTDMLPVVDAISVWVTENPELIRQAFSIVGALGGVVAVMIPLRSAFSGITGVMQVANGLFTVMRAGALMLAGGLSPILIPIGALIAGGLALLNVIGGDEGIVGGFKKAVTAAQQLVTLGIMVVQSAFESFVSSPLFATLKTIFEEAFRIGGNVIEGVVGFFGSVIQAIVNFTQSETFASIVGAFEGAFNFGVSIIEGVVGFFGSVIQAIVDFTQSETFASIIGAFEGAFNFGVSIVEGVVGFFGSVIQAIVDFTQSETFTLITNIFQSTFDLVADIINMFVGTIATIANAIADVINSPFFQQLVTIFTTVLGGTITGIINLFTGVITGIGGFIQSVSESPAFQSVVGAFEDAFTNAGNFINDVLGIIDEILVHIQTVVDSDIFKTLENVFSGAFNTIKGIVEGAMNIVGGLISAPLNIARDLLTTLGLINAASGQGHGMTMDAIVGGATSWMFETGGMLGTSITPTAVPGNMFGGNVRAGQMSWVGEDGPELVRFGQSGTVFSNPGTAGGNNYRGAMMGGAGGGVVISGTINVYGVQDVNDLLDQLNTISSRRSAQ